MPSKRNPAVSYQDMLHAIELIERYLDKTDFVAFQEDVQKQDAVLRRLEIVLEASHRLRPEEKLLCEPQDWRAMHSLGNQLRHNYDSIDLVEVWGIIEQDLPKLKADVEQTLQRHFPDAPAR